MVACLNEKKITASTLAIGHVPLVDIVVGSNPFKPFFLLFCGAQFDNPSHLSSLLV